jgi:hypothetical protein
MAAKRFMVGDFTRTGFLEALGSGTIGFDLRHISVLL